MEDSKQVRKNQLNLNDRKEALITGVRDVRSFDDHEIILETDLGILMIRGSDLHMGRLTLEKGEVDVTGRMDSFVYSELKGFTKSGESVFKRLFK
ncbi:sporulation protein YabP [Lachnoclostridium phytofermentans]|uniref:Sporulation protein YabP n=1 Tax=Lachnoclostridium phytofermentans (strain ATCC 700394 / DSM 18823 / ISDg) TaxID=357809 RepID=A9KR56_LACP7|nr:sporulation protein YabP [Lachnoclostridium phytofermentans]ABX40524.1 sporulation protein YabP [Lachnoclostridium phytofermentans ISDg]